MKTFDSIEITKQLVKEGKISQEIAETIFPELKESYDERIRKALLHVIYEKSSFLTVINGINVKDIIAWLKYLKGRIQPQLKQEWSEEDEKMVGHIRGIIERYAFSQSAVDVNGELCEREFIEPDEWIRTLKERLQPYPVWKPSDKQMESLKTVCWGLSKHPLHTLYNDLKKLKDQPVLAVINHTACEMQKDLKKLKSEI